MRSEEAIRNDIAQAELAMRSIHDKAHDLGAAFDIEAARKELEGLASRKAQLQRELAELMKPVARDERMAALLTRESLLKAAADQRALVIGTSNIGAVNQIRQLFKEIAETDSILNYASYYYGPNAATNIPVLAPMEDPAFYGEGETNVLLDTSANITVTELKPQTLASALSVTAEMIQMGVVEIETQIPDLFRAAFQKKMHWQMLHGSGSNREFTGIFTTAAANTSKQTPAAGSNITVTELAGLALQISSLDTSFRIIMHPSIYQGILSDTQNTEDIKIYKEGLIRDKSIEGIPILLDAYAPKATTSGSVLAVACPLSRYAIAIAGELKIIPKYKPQDTHTYYDAIMFANGKQVSENDLYSIVAA